MAVVLLVLEMKNLGKTKAKNKMIIDKKNTENVLNKHIVITISREYGSGGRYVGKLISEKLGIKFYDKDFVEMILFWIE